MLRSCHSVESSSPSSASAPATGTENWQLGIPLVRGRAGHLFLFQRLDQLHVEAERLQFADQNVEGLRYARLDRGFTLNNGFVNLGAAINVVALGREQLLQNERRSVRFQGPDFHLSE